MSTENVGVFYVINYNRRLVVTNILERRCFLKNELSEVENINNIYENIKILINNSKENVYRVVNTEILNLYWNIGKIIVDIQDGKNRAKYGDKILENLSLKLTNEFGNGFYSKNLRRMRQFYLMFQNWTSLMSNLTWTHYTEIIKIKDKKQREFNVSKQDGV